MEIRFSRMYVILHLFAVFALFVSPFIFFNVYADDDQKIWVVTIPNGASEEGQFHGFTPNELPVAVGDTIVWENKDSVIHSIASGLPDKPDHAGLFFDLGKINPGGSNAHVLTNTDYSAFYYFCEIHPWMTGKIFTGNLGIAQPETDGPIILEKQMYNYGDKILISGQVHKDFAGTKYSTLIYNQNNDLVTISDGFFDDNAEYLQEIDTKGSAWNTVGEYQVKIVYAVPSKVAQINFELSTGYSANESTKVIPEWIKNVADYWCNDQIDNTEFVNTIQYLIREGIIEIKNEKSSTLDSSGMPEWVKNNACWWSQDKIPEPDFIFGIEYLVNNGIISV